MSESLIGILASNGFTMTALRLRMLIKSKLLIWHLRLSYLMKDFIFVKKNSEYIYILNFHLEFQVPTLLSVIWKFLKIYFSTTCGSQWNS